MKQVLLVDATLTLFQYLKSNLSQKLVNVDLTLSGRTAYTTLISMLPDLVIVDLNSIDDEALDFLKKKTEDPNAKNIPVIVVGTESDRAKIPQLLNYNVHRYFLKPFKYDLLFKAIGEILDMNFVADQTNCIMEMHINENIIFVEIANGLNRDKISLLKFKIKEISNKYKIAKPKLVILLSNMELNFLDTSNITFLMDTVLSDRIIRRSNIKIISTDSFVKEFIKGHSEYQDVEVLENINEAINPLLEIFSQPENNDSLVHRILQPVQEVPEDDIDLRFSTDYDSAEIKPYDAGEILRIAIVDDDQISRKILEATFKRIHAESVLYESGISFLNDLANEQFDLIILDVFIPDMNGLDILRNLQRRNYQSPVIIHSQATERNYIVEALSLGAKKYLIKPQKPEAIINTAITVLQPTSESSF